MNRIALLALPLLAVAANAQTRTFVPQADAAADSIGFETNPFNDTVPSPGRFMYVQDGQMFLDAGVLNAPVLIQEIRIRWDNESGFPDSWTGGTDPNFTLDLSTSPADYSLAVSTFDTNHGADRVRVFNGPLTIPGGATPGDGLPGPFDIVLTLSTPFIYDATAGDLCLDFTYSGAQPSSWGTWHDETDVLSSLDIRGTHLEEDTSATAVTATTTTVGEALCFDLLWVPAAGLFPSFSQDVAAGPSPLTVNFTDTTYTDDPGGVLSVRFDFDSDGTYDATTVAGGSVANVYGCGTFDVTVESTDSLNGTATNTVVGAVIADEVTLAISASALLVNQGDTVNFSATATAGAALAWDLDGDGIVDDTTATPSFIYGAPGLYNVTCDATLSCNTVTESLVIDVRAGIIITPPFTGSFTYGAGGVSWFDVTVTSANGVVIEQLLHSSSVVNDPTDIEVYMLNAPLASTIGNEDPSNFMLVGTGTGVSPAIANERFAIDVPDIVLAPGTYGFAVVNTLGSQTMDTNTGGTGTVISNADLSIAPNGAAFDFLPGSFVYTNEGWNGGFLYGAVNDLIPNFFGDVTAGNSPLTVNFTDQSLTNDAIGILSWAWDFENDGLVDDVNQNPTFTFTSCGDFDVSLTVVDATNGSRTLVKPAYIQTDVFTASFTQDKSFASVGDTVNFTYTGDPAAVAQWDLDGDTLVDAVGPTAAFTYTAAGSYTITLTAQLNCRSETATGSLSVINTFVEADNGAGTFVSFTTPPDCAYFDVFVKNIQGITVTDVGTRSPSTDPQTLEVWGMLGSSVVDMYANTNYTLLATASFQPSVADELVVVDVPDFTLPVGVHGLVTVHRATTGGSGMTWWSGNSGNVTGDANLEITPVGADSDFDFQTSNTGISYTTNSFAGLIAYSPGGAPPAPGSVGVFGAGCAGSLGVPDIQPGVNPPQIGTTWSARVTNVQAGVQIHGGVSTTFNPQFGVPLPFALGPVLGTNSNCFFRVSSDVILLAFPNAFGEAVFTFPIPNNPIFSGLVVYVQGLVFDAGAQGGIVTSNALYGRVL